MSTFLATFTIVILFNNLATAARPRIVPRAERGSALQPVVFRVVVGILALAAAGLFTDAQAAHVPNHKRAGSYDVDIGVVPAKQARLSESQMGSAAHREAERRTDYHLVVSLRDIESGALVADAVVRAQVGPLGMSQQTKLLDLMTISNAASYGNYFAIPGRGPFTVHLEIERPGASVARSEVVFSLRLD